MNSPDRKLLIACRWLYCPAIWCLLILLAISLPASASLFKTPEQEAVGKFEDGDYAAAATEFSDNYRRGVALYRAGRYKDAGEAFASVEREDVKADALYNLGMIKLKAFNDRKGALAAWTQLKGITQDQTLIAELDKRIAELRQPLSNGSGKVPAGTAPGSQSTGATGATGPSGVTTTGTVLQLPLQSKDHPK